MSKNGFFWNHSSSSFFFFGVFMDLGQHSRDILTSQLVDKANLLHGCRSANPAFCLATRAGKMGLSCPLGISRLGPARKKNSLFHGIINSLLTKFVRSRWLDTGLVLFYAFIDLNFVSHQKRTWPVYRHLDLTLGK